MVAQRAVIVALSDAPAPLAAPRSKATGTRTPRCRRRRPRRRRHRGHRGRRGRHRRRCRPRRRSRRPRRSRRSAGRGRCRRSPSGSPASRNCPRHPRGGPGACGRPRGARSCRTGTSRPPTSCTARDPRTRTRRRCAALTSAHRPPFASTTRVSAHDVVHDELHPVHARPAVRRVHRHVTGAPHDAGPDERPGRLPGHLRVRVVGHRELRAEEADDLAAPVTRPSGPGRSHPSENVNPAASGFASSRPVEHGPRIAEVTTRSAVLVPRAESGRRRVVMVLSRSAVD